MSSKNTYSKRKFLIAFVCVMGGFAAIRHLALPDGGVKARVEEKTAAAEGRDADTGMESVDELEVIDNLENAEANDDFDQDEDDDTAEAADSLAIDDSLDAEDEADTIAAAPDAVPSDSVPRTVAVRRWWRSPVWSYDKCFPDLQETQLEAAIRNGITPVANRDEAERLVSTHALVNASHSPYYRLDELTHSMPYLVPRAQQLLNTICINFIDSCQSKGIPLHLPIVTSVLRTAADVSRLQRGNINATTNSCHCYGTTVDITYNKFYPVTDSYVAHPELTRWDDALKRVLGEVLLDLRKRGLCYVKYERKQACFHLTCR